MRRPESFLREELDRWMRGHWPTRGARGDDDRWDKFPYFGTRAEEEGREGSERGRGSGAPGLLPSAPHQGSGVPRRRAGRSKAQPARQPGPSPARRVHDVGLAPTSGGPAARNSTVSAAARHRPLGERQAGHRPADTVADSCPPCLRRIRAGPVGRVVPGEESSAALAAALPGTARALPEGDKRDASDLLPP